MYPAVFDENKLLLIDRLKHNYLPATYVPAEYLHLIIPYAGLYFDYDDEHEMLSQHIPVGPFRIWMHDIYAKKDIVLRPYTPFHLWALHFMYEDSLRPQHFGTGELMLNEKECNLFNLHSELHEVPMPAGAKILSFHINIQQSDLVWLDKAYPGLQHLSRKRPDKISGVLNARPYRINAVCNMLIQRIISCRYIEAQAHHFLYRCCLDLFLNFAQQDASAPETMLIANETQATLFYQIYAYLQEHPHVPHDQVELAKMFNMSGPQLVQGFRRYFSVGITPFIHMVRMMLVYNHMMEKSFSLSMIAAAAGYRNKDEMVAEVQKYYNCDVIALRRSM